MTKKQEPGRGQVSVGRFDELAKLTYYKTSARDRAGGQGKWKLPNVRHCYRNGNLPWAKGMQVGYKTRPKMGQASFRSPIE